MNDHAFFDIVRHSVFGGALTPNQVEGLNKILDYRDEKYPAITEAQFAYILATAFWESARTMQPITELGTERYLRAKPYYPWIGRGLVQVTWDYNYKKFGALHPEDMLKWPQALDALFRGMLDGMFTAHKLSEFVNAEKADFFHARKVVNGLDKAAVISTIALCFWKALQASEEK
jgi:hypothetical protein